MPRVFLTVDVEVWCDGWNDLDAKFSESFERYVYGSTPAGKQGLPAQLELLRDHGLKAVFFVEPLFATRFGPGPLQEIVGLIQDHGQEVQLHLHTEWVDESPVPLLQEPGPRVKRQFLRQFSLDEQVQLLRLGRNLLEDAGAHGVTAFRAGSFGFNSQTLEALAQVGMRVDSSYNATMFGPSSGVAPGAVLLDATRLGPIVELPMTVFRDGVGRMRHLQLGACSAGEFEAVLEQAERQARWGVVALSHNFELMNEDKTRVDPIVRRRMERVCRFLDRHRDRFATSWMDGIDDVESPPPGRELRAPMGPTMVRWFEQTLRRGLA